MQPNNALTQAHLQTFLSYAADSGVFIWLRVTTHHVKVGSVAGARNLDGYITISLHGRRYYAHRLAWLYVTGQWPHAIVDHRDRCRDNNRFENLRVVSDTENAHNAGARRNNTSGVPGVSWCKKSEKWFAKICVHRRQISLGFYPTLAEAASVRVAAQASLHPAFTSRGTSDSR